VGWGRRRATEGGAFSASAKKSFVDGRGAQGRTGVKEETGESAYFVLQIHGSASRYSRRKGRGGEGGYSPKGGVSNNLAEGLEINNNN